MKDLAVRIEKGIGAPLTDAEVRQIVAALRLAEAFDNVRELLDAPTPTPRSKEFDKRDREKDLAARCNAALDAYRRARGAK